MEFDINRVYTSVNADELKVGSKVIVSDCIAELKDLVANYKDVYTRVLTNICSESSLDGRFETVTSIYQFAYLIEPPEEKKLKWTDLKIGDVIRKKYEDGYRFAMVTRIDTYSCDNHIGLCFDWLTDEDLAKWEKVE